MTGRQEDAETCPEKQSIAASMVTASCLRLLLACGAGSSLLNNGMGGITMEGKLQLLAFCVFEGCVGVFWPSMMALRAHYVPEHMRSTIMNIFRVPLNAFVCLVLCQVSRKHRPCRPSTLACVHAWPVWHVAPCVTQPASKHTHRCYRSTSHAWLCLQVHRFPLSVMFGLCVAFLGISGGLQLYLNRIIAEDDEASGDDSKHGKLVAELHGSTPSHGQAHGLASGPAHGTGAHSHVLSIGSDGGGHSSSGGVSGSGVNGPSRSRRLSKDGTPAIER